MNLMWRADWIFEDTGQMEEIETRTFSGQELGRDRFAFSANDIMDD